MTPSETTGHAVRDHDISTGTRSLAEIQELTDRLSDVEPVDVEMMDAWWRASNYLTVGQIYLQDNPLLREPLTAEHIKPRLLGHWGTSPGLSLHLRARVAADPAHRPGDDLPRRPRPRRAGAGRRRLPRGHLQRDLPRRHPDETGVRRLFRQFSAPGGIPSHVSVTTPGSIHEGGELGYVLVHAFGAVMDNPDLIALAVVGDGEAETGPLEGSWKGISFLNPERDGAVLPVLHLNGGKIAGPTVLARKDPAEVRSLLEGHGYDVIEVEGDDLPGMHLPFAAALAEAWGTIRAHPAAGTQRRLGRWPAALADDRPAQPQGLDRPRRGRRDPGARAPGARTRCRCPGCARTPSTWRCSRPGCGRTVPTSCSTRSGAPDREVVLAEPRRRPADERHPARQRRLADRATSTCPTSGLRPRRAGAGARSAPSPRGTLGELLRDIYTAQPATASGCSAPTRRTATGWALCSRSSDRAFAERVTDGDVKISPRRAGDGGAQSSTTATAGSRATRSPGGTGCSPPTRRSRWSARRRPSSTASGSRRPRTCPWRAQCPASTSCSPRPRGATTTTASRTRGPG